MASFPPLEALFLAHFDDIKGQTVCFWASAGVAQGDIEHAALPSGLHQLDQDLVCFLHGGRPAVGLFRGKSVDGGRGRRMGTLGVVLAEDDDSAVFALQEALSEVYDRIEAASSGGTSPFVSPAEGGSSSATWTGGKGRTEEILSSVWEEYRVDEPRSEGSAPGPSGHTRSHDDRIRRLADGRQAVHVRVTTTATPAETIVLIYQARSAITYFPALLGLLGPQIIPVYRAALTGKRILIYSTPPLLPLAAFAWCIAASSLSPRSCDAGTSAWLGNIGLMDLQALKSRRGGWVATTSDAIYRSHAVYDLFIDLTATPPTLHAAPSPASGAAQPGRKLSYAMSDLPLYRTLLLLDTSPPGIHVEPTRAASTLAAADPGDDADPLLSAAEAQTDAQSIYARQGGWWLLAFDVFSRAWNLCAGVCAYAVGTGAAGSGQGEIALDEGEEDARLLPDGEDMLDDGLTEEEDGPDASKDEDEAVRRGRLLLRQFHHNTYHLHARLRTVLGRTRPANLSRTHLRELCRARIFSKADEAVFWRILAERWGFIDGGHDDTDDT